MRHALMALALTLQLSGLMSGLAQAETLEAGTPVQLRFLTPVSSDTCHEGQGVSLAVAQDVQDPQTHRLLLRSGSPAYGYISRVEESGIAGKKGELGLSLEYALADDGTRVPLKASLETVGQNRRVAAIGLSVLGAVVFYPLMLAIFAKGKRAAIPSGSQMTAYVAKPTPIYPLSPHPATMPLRP